MQVYLENASQSETRYFLILPPHYGICRTTCVSRHTQLRTGGFCCSEVLLPACPCLWQLSHSNSGEDTRLPLIDVTCTVSVPLLFSDAFRILQL